ncbi:hypothetical protein [Burkholderia plantarii]|uniref:hypothetical protein n=1 Tax=Burkholderia plantarii TaxID=41899 RepID=UPI0013141242
MKKMLAGAGGDVGSRHDTRATVPSDPDFSGSAKPFDERRPGPVTVAARGRA